VGEEGIDGGIFLSNIVHLLLLFSLRAFPSHFVVGWVMRHVPWGPSASVSRSLRARKSWRDGRDVCNPQRRALIGWGWCWRSISIFIHIYLKMRIKINLCIEC
jgi:hypothetical protein